MRGRERRCQPRGRSWQDWKTCNGRAGPGLTRHHRCCGEHGEERRRPGLLCQAPPAHPRPGTARRRPGLVQDSLYLQTFRRRVPSGSAHMLAKECSNWSLEPKWLRPVVLVLLQDDRGCAADTMGGNIGTTSNKLVQVCLHCHIAGHRVATTDSGSILHHDTGHRCLLFEHLHLHNTAQNAQSAADVNDVNLK